RHRLVAEQVQDVGQLASVGIVCGNDGDAVQPAGRVAAAGLGRVILGGRFRRLHGQVDVESGSAAALAVDADQAVVEFDETLAGHQPQSGAAVAGGEE